MVSMLCAFYHSVTYVAKAQVNASKAKAIELKAKSNEHKAKKKNQRPNHHYPKRFY